MHVFAFKGSHYVKFPSFFFFINNKILCLFIQLSPSGRKYAEALSKFIKEQRVQFALDLVHEQHKREEIWKSKGLEPLEKTDGSRTPEELMKAKAESICNSQFIIWTSMLKRAMSTAAYFDPDEYDIKVNKNNSNKKNQEKKGREMGILTNNTTIIVFSIFVS